MAKARIIGVPGAGKTTRGMEIVAKVRQHGYSLEQIAFCTFTRAARREASWRASQIFGVSIDHLEKNGWFRTIHSACARLLRLPRGSIVNHDVDWLRQALDEPSLDVADDEDDEEAWSSQWRGRCPAQIALSLWDVARNRLVPFDVLFDEIVYRLGREPLAQAEAEGIVERYEKAKHRDGRLDFCDLILRYAGVHMTLTGPEECPPQGDIPAVPVWIFDEAQDTSPLLDRAAQRLSHGAIWLYLMGDREQSIYQWAGANGDLFMRWQVEKQEYLRKTWRCARNIIDLGLRLIYSNDDITRELRTLAVEARCDGGKIVESDECDFVDRLSDPYVPTLVMARTNQLVSALQQQLSLAKIPWKSMRSGARWPSAVSTKTALALAALNGGQTIDGDQWRRLVQAVPKEYLQRGTKAFYKEAASKEEVRNCRLETLIAHGANRGFVDLLRSENWLNLLGENERTAYRARKKWGDLVDDPRIVVSTIHGSKGMQADRVLLSTRINGAVAKNLRTPEGENEERRVWYVGATRARDELVLLRGRGKNYEDLYDVI